MSFEPRCAATGIGSLPHDDVDRAIAAVCASMPDLPYVPQLPALGWHEGMMVQYTEGLPGRVLDEEKEKIHLDIADAGLVELEDFYLRVIADDPDAFEVSEGYLHGLPALEAAVGRPGVGVKTQLTGPVTQGLNMVDQAKRAIFYDETFQEVVLKNCAMKARWMVRRLRARHDRVLCFLDEPILSAFGSSVYVTVRRDAVIGQIREVADAIRAEGGLCGVHCCGNTEWSLLTDAGVDVISFDAYEFGHTLPLYPEQVKAWIEGGGVVAWGVVPTSADIAEQTVDTLVERLAHAVAGVEALGIPRDRLLRQALLTPACGLGSVSPGLAERAFTLLRGLSERMQAEIA